MRSLHYEYSWRKDRDLMEFVDEGYNSSKPEQETKNMVQVNLDGSKPTEGPEKVWIEDDAYDATLTEISE